MLVYRYVSILPLPFFLVLLSRVHMVTIPLPSTAPSYSSVYRFIYILPYIRNYIYTSLTLHLSFKTSTKTPGCFAFTLANSIVPTTTSRGAALSMCPTFFCSDVSMDLKTIYTESTIFLKSYTVSPLLLLPLTLHPYLSQVIIHK